MSDDSDTEAHIQLVKTLTENPQIIEALAKGTIRIDLNYESISTYENTKTEQDEDGYDVESTVEERYCARPRLTIRPVRRWFW